MKKNPMYRFEKKYAPVFDIIKSRAPFSPEIALTLGSGLGGFAECVDIVHTISSDELPGYPASTVEGHKGKIHFAKYKDKKILMFQGRIHFYEGLKLESCLLPVMISRYTGAEKMLLTNAAGGIASDLNPGDLMIITSIISANIKKELTDVIGVTDYEGKISFNDFPAVSILNALEESAKENNIPVKKGVYWYCKGPSYETPAEINMIKKFGGDAVGMSTVYEAIFAAYLGIKTASVSCITNYAAGISQVKLSHEEVTLTADMAKSSFEQLIKSTIVKL